MSLKSPLLCNAESPQEDTQDHIIKCTKLRKGTQMNIDQMYDDGLKVQGTVVKSISMLLKTRQRLIEEQEDLNLSLPGALFLDQSIQQQLHSLSFSNLDSNTYIYRTKGHLLRILISFSPFLKDSFDSFYWPS